MQDKRTKTKDWMSEVKMATAMNGRGRKKGMIEAMMTMSSSSAKMLPKSRIDRETGREKWLMISIGIISGARAGMGPMKCLKYLRPWALTPWAW